MKMERENHYKHHYFSFISLILFAMTIIFAIFAKVKHETNQFSS